MSELWYDDHRKDAESFSVELILYNYGEDLQVLRERIALLEAENQQLRDPNWVTYIGLTKAWLEKYPPDIFTGVSGDPGPLFVVALRNALAALLQEGKP